MIHCGAFPFIQNILKRKKNITGNPKISFEFQKAVAFFSAFASHPVINCVHVASHVYTGQHVYTHTHAHTLPLRGFLPLEALISSCAHSPITGCARDLFS